MRGMKYLALLALAALTALTGCQTPYTKFTVTDYQGHQVAEWIAEGAVKKTDQGYAIKAVERTSREPNPVNTHYPNGWAAKVVGPNIVRQRVDKPAWLVELDGQAAPVGLAK